jgi:uncharacterized protein (TIGR00375 family)
MYKAADLHIHSCFSMASSPRMIPGEILSGSRIKGISVVGTGDILHPEWRQMWENQSVPEDILVIPTTEVEGLKRVHHLILLPDYSAAEDLADIFSRSSNNIASNGRPQVKLSGEEILMHVHNVGGIGGPAHAFTPYTSVYAAFDSLNSCYGNERVDLLELGLSADSSYGAGIEELSHIPFLTNSDAHSPDPAKLGREFTVFDVHSFSVEGVMDAVTKGDIIMNIGFFPEEGKYNRTACSRCFRHYSLQEALHYKWKCPDDEGRIKRGVKDRAGSLSSDNMTTRPPYLHLIPLIEIIQRLFHLSSPSVRRCKELYDCCIRRFGDEITVLTKASPEAIKEISPGLSEAVMAFRKGEIILHPGGGGRYGTFDIPGL